LRGKEADHAAQEENKADPLGDGKNAKAPSQDIAPEILQQKTLHCVQAKIQKECIKGPTAARETPRSAFAKCSCFRSASM